MKIRISFLLLTNAAFLLFGELNAAYKSSGQRVQGTGLIAVQKLPQDGEHHAVAYYGDMPIELWLEKDGTVRKAYYYGCQLPEPVYYVHHDIVTRYIRLQGHSLIAYLDGKGGLIGVRGPNLALLRSGANNPTPSEWYMSYDTKKYKLTVNPETRMVIGITLLGPKVIDHNGETPQPATCAGLKFNVFTKGGYTTGAEMIENYHYTIGDSIPQPVLGKRKGTGSVRSRKTSSGATSSRGKAAME